MHVLITGSAGMLGRVLVAGLGERHRLRGYDLQPTPGVEDSVIGDLGDPERLTRAAAGVDGIVHLGAVVGGAHRWEDVLSANIIGMLDHGRRAIGYHPQDRCELTEQADTSPRFRD